MSTQVSIGDKFFSCAEAKLTSVIENTLQNLSWFGCADRTFHVTHPSLHQPLAARRLVARAKEKYGVVDVETVVKDNKLLLVFGQGSDRVASVGGNEPVAPMAFAVMRNSHEAMRIAIRDMNDMCDKGDFAGLRQEFLLYTRFLAVHARMEDAAMFPLLDSVSSPGLMEKEGLFKEHSVDDGQVAAVKNAATDEQLRDAFRTWRASHLAHLKHEEDLMMPLTQKTAPTPKARAQVFASKVLSARGDDDEWDFCVGWAVYRLSRNATMQPAPVATRVFCWGLQHSATDAEWRRWLPIIKQNCAQNVYDEMCTNFDIDRPGKL